MKSRNICRRLLVVVSVCFLLSAWLYCMATIHVMRQGDELRADEQAAGLIAFFRDHGSKVLGAEIAALAVCAVALVLLERQKPANRGQSSLTNTRDDVERAEYEQPGQASTKNSDS